MIDDKIDADLLPMLDKVDKFIEEGLCKQDDFEADLMEVHN